MAHSGSPPPVALPASFVEAATRGLRSRCPRCAQARLFRQWLKPVDSCPACAQDWSLQRADDFPAYVAILVTGHLLAPLIIFLVLRFELSVPVLTALILTLAMAMMLGILQPAKGAIIAAQWWHGLHGFRKERPLPGPEVKAP